MIRVLTILGHPRQGGFNWKLYQEINWFCKANRFHLKTIDLYREDFDPVVREHEPDINMRMAANYREMIEWSDVVVIVSPVWWHRCSTMVEGFFDKVLTRGFAFSVSHDKRGGEHLAPLLGGRTVMAFLSFGTSSLLGRAVLANIARLRLLMGVIWPCFGRRRCAVHCFFGMNDERRHDDAVEAAFSRLRRLELSDERKVP